MVMEEEEKPKYSGYGYHGGGRKPTGRKTRSVSATDEEWQALKELAQKAGKDVSRFLIETALEKQ